MSRWLPPAYEQSVFINCPFDPEFRDLMLAIILTVVAHGFVPRGAREVEGVAQPRFRRILETISESKYSIHDLSRFTGEGVANLARFNMPSSWVCPQRSSSSAMVQVDRTSGSLWFPMDSRTNSSSPTLPALIPADIMGPSLQLSERSAPGFGYRTTPSTPHPRHCASTIALRLFDNRSQRFERKHSRKKPGRIYFSLLT